MRKIRWRGVEYLLTGNDEGAITTEERYRAGIVSIAHLFPDGRIMQHREQVGTRDDIEFGEEVNVRLTLNEMFDGVRNMLTHPSWEPRQ